MTITQRFSRIHDGQYYVLKSLFEAMALPRHGRVLDIGCGGDSGNQSTIYLADYFESVIDGLERLSDRADDVRKG